jgi:hypothetical protein
MTVFVLGCVALGLGLGYLLNSRSPGSSENAGKTTATTEQTTTPTTAKVLGATVTAPTLPLVTSTTVAPTTTTVAPTTTTTRARAAAASKNKAATTPTTRHSQPAKPKTAKCAEGTAATELSGNYDATTAASNVVATVKNPNGKAIVVDQLVVHLHYADGSDHHVTVVKPGDSGTSVAANAAKDFAFTDSSAATLDSMDVETFVVHYADQPECASK